jgi:hypothetical protein
MTLRCEYTYNLCVCWYNWFCFHRSFCCITLLGLKQALATVNDYNPLMKDFPINDLLSATELDRIRTAVQLIFSHLRKIRSTKYPIQRALRLVESISRDLSSQLLKVSAYQNSSWVYVFKGMLNKLGVMCSIM